LLTAAAAAADAASKFAVKGFTESLYVEFQTHAPHIHAAVVMPGHVATSIAAKSNAEVDPGKKTYLFGNLYQKESFHQDRLGTSIGKAPKERRDAVSYRDWRVEAEGPVAAGASCDDRARLRAEPEDGQGAKTA
jgi:NAD(P)-dependent dehydrogenase (short-subunit alcohol dehydrogenase family)